MKACRPIPTPAALAHRGKPRRRHIPYLADGTNRELEERITEAVVTKISPIAQASCAAFWRRFPAGKRPAMSRPWPTRKWRTNFVGRRDSKTGELNASRVARRGDRRARRRQGRRHKFRRPRRCRTYGFA